MSPPPSDTRSSTCPKFTTHSPPSEAGCSDGTTAITGKALPLRSSYADLATPGLLLNEGAQRFENKMFPTEMLVSRPGLGLETVQDHFLVVLVLVLVSIGPVLVSVLVSNTGSKKVLVGLGHCMHGQALKGAFNNHCQSVEGLV
jgi:hypothetical protein